MSTQHRFEISYLYHNEAHAKIVESEHEHWPLHRAARYLIELHHADAENSLLMPAADASPEDIVEQAEVLGITAIRISAATAAR